MTDENEPVGPDPARQPPAAAGDRAGPPADPADEPAGTPSGPDDAPARRGRIRYQDPATTTPREPTLAEQRARQVAEQRTLDDELAAEAADARKRKIRKRVLIGGGVAVGLAAVVAIGYAASGPDTVSARCVDDNQVVVDDSNCDESRAGGFGGGGIYPIFLGGFGRQYHYYYGGGGGIGSVANGGSTVAPKSANVSTPSGKSIQRGGFGVSNGGSSGGTGKSSGSSSGS